VSRNRCGGAGSGETSFEYERLVQPRPKLDDGQLNSTDCWQGMGKAAREHLRDPDLEELRGAL